MASTNKEFTYSSLNFDDIKESLINTFKNDKTFADYNFEGAGLNILMDMLAYVTHMTAVTANISSNEMFMDSAQLRQSIVSKAKELGYRPHSGLAPQARLKLTFRIPNTPAEKRDKIVIPAGTQFGCAFNTVFSTKDEYIFLPTDYEYARSGEGEDEKLYTYVKDENEQKVITHIIFEGEIIVYEGYYHEVQYIVDYDNPDQRFIIPSDKADLTTLTVQVIEGTTVKTFFENDNLNVLTPESLVYFLHQNPDDLFEVTFGDGVLGYKIKDLSVIVLKFIAYDKGKEMNGLKKITKIQPIDNTNRYEIEMMALEGDDLKIVSGGCDMEAGDHIRERATKMWKTQNRTVTADDYRTLLLNEYPWIECISVWGGQYNNPPQYGKVFISVKPKHTDKLAYYLKNKIKQELIKKYNILTCIPEIVDLDYLYVGLKINIKYDKSTTTLSLENIKGKIDKRIAEYFENTVEKFEKTLYWSPVVTIIDQSDPCIISSTSDFYIEKRIYPKTYSKEIFELKFTNALVPGSIKSSIFNTGTQSIYVPCSIKDDGDGNLHIWNLDATNRPLVSNIGTVNYKTGEMNFSLITYQLPESNDVKIYADTVDKDISPGFNQIILKDKSVEIEDWGIRPGIMITHENVTNYKR